MKKSSLKAITLLMSVLLVFQIGNLSIYAESTAFYTAETQVAPMDANVEAPDGAPTVNCKSAILMEAGTGTILYTKNAYEALPPASVTKVMTLLLVMEAIDQNRISLTDTVTVSANAASMGGSQVYLKEGEQMSLEDMLKSVVIASANDAAVALAEYLCGSVDAFVSKMNQRAEQLGMKNTHFENVTGLDDTAQNHLTSAHDIAVMSRELIRHKTILQYSSIWMDTIRNGEFGLTNTNRLVRFYNGCTGLKTGSTEKAGFCVSATAERDGMSLICVIMGAETRDIRNANATALLDWGFANYALYKAPAEEMPPVYVIGGNVSTCHTISSDFLCVLPKSELAAMERVVELPEKINAPVSRGDTVGHVVFKVGDRIVGEGSIVSLDNISKMNFFEILSHSFARFLLI